MKKSQHIQSVICFAIALLAGCAPQSPQPTDTPSSISITTLPATFSINGRGVEFSGYKRENGYFTVDVCFDPPSKQIWMFDEVIFKIEQQEIPLYWTRANANPGRKDGFACNSLSYKIDLVPNSGRAELSIGQLQTDVNEYDCSKAQKKLNAAKTGIVVTCDPGLLGNNPGFGILKKPATMSDEEAYNLAKDAFSETVQVNWMFSFLVENP